MPFIFLGKMHKVFIINKIKIKSYMGLIKENGRNISISNKNGYSVENYWIAKDYIKKVGVNRRNLDVNELVDTYNKVKHTNVKIGSCKPCSVSKYFNSLRNYVQYAEILFKANGIDYSRQAEKKVEPVKVEEPAINEPIKVEDEIVKEDIKPKKRNKKNDVEDND